MDSTEPLDSSSAQVVLSMLYDIAFNICDHNKPENNHPFASILMHDAEEYREHSGLYRSIERFHKQKLNDRFGISLSEYWSYPKYVVDMITEIVFDMSNDKKQVEDDVERQIEKEMGKDKT